MKPKILVSALVVATLVGVTLAVPAKAMTLKRDHCDVNLNYDISMAPAELVYSEQGKELYRFVPGKVFVEGKEIELNARQRTLADNYAANVSRQVPEVIALVGDAMNMASLALDKALTPLLGEETSTKVAGLVAKVNERMGKVMHQDGERYYLNGANEDMDKMFGDEFEQEVEDLVQDSMASLMIHLGQEMMNTSGDTFEARMEAFGNKMDAMGEELERELDGQSKVLEARAEKLCDALESLQVEEKLLRSEIPELSSLKLTDAKPASLSALN